MKDHIDLNTGRATAEIEARTELVRFLASQSGSTNSIFAAEVVYGFESRRADFLKLDTQSHAYEIKSDFDNTSRLSGQLAEYSKTFDFVTIVTTPKHLREVREIASRKIGLMVIDGQRLKPVRKPALNRQLSKLHLVSGTTKARLLSALPSGLRNLSVAEVRAEAAKALTVAELRNLFLAELKDRFSETSAIFFAETDADIRSEDLLLLRRSPRLFS